MGVIDGEFESKWHAKQYAKEIKKAIIYIAIGYLLAVGVYLL